LNPDFHCHSIASDGTLSPEVVAARAAANGVTHWALTDHDTIDGLAAARDVATDAGMTFVSGVEISVSWQWQTIHVVGLGIDPENADLAAGLAEVRGARRARAERIAEKLAKAGIPGALEGACAHATNPDLIGRTHFARHLVERGVVAHLDAAFQQYLGTGRAGYVPHQWATMGDAVAWIVGAGGVAVIAHPGRYRLAATRFDALVAEFKSSGGTAMEVVSGSQGADRSGEFEALCRRHGLAASRGSDFHEPGVGRYDLGRMPDLPGGVPPVWSLLR